MVVRKLVQRGQGNVKGASSRVVDSQNIDGSAIVSQLPATSTVGAVPSSYSSCTSNVGECGERTEGGESYHERSVNMYGYNQSEACH